MGRSNLDQTSQALLCWRTEPPRILPAPAVHAVAVRLPASEPGPASRITLGGAPNLERLDDLAHPTSGTAGHPLAARAAPGGRPHFCRSVTYWSYSMADTGCMYRRIGPSSKNFDQGSPGAAHAPPPRPQCGVRQRGSTRVQRPPAGARARAWPAGSRVSLGCRAAFLLRFLIGKQPKLLILRARRPGSTTALLEKIVRSVVSYQGFAHSGFRSPVSLLQSCTRD
eukprot:SAG25_NODE_301_length_10166_cov_46.413927_3_plen_225_part_00